MTEGYSSRCRQRLVSYQIFEEVVTHPRLDAGANEVKFKGDCRSRNANLLVEPSDPGQFGGTYYYTGKPAFEGGRV